MIKTLRVKVLWAALLALSFTAFLGLSFFPMVSAATTYGWVDENTIRNQVTDGAVDFKKISTSPLEYMAQMPASGGVTCPYIIKVKAPLASSGTLYEGQPSYGGPGGQATGCSKNDTNNPKSITIAKAATPPIDNTTNKDTQSDDCPVGDEPLRWASCGLITLGQNAAAAMDATIQKFLYTPTDQIFSPQMKTAWNSFRTLGVSLILIAGLVMVISQAMGVEIFDAYTVRKVLPRLLIAAIGIALSWPILQFVVTFFNDLGLWSHDLILAPFPEGANMSGGAIIGAFLATGAAAGAYAFATMSTGGTLALLGTIVLAALIGLLVLALRQLAILVCVLFAPLAIACYILPGTQKIWKFWKDTLVTALAMFPIIMAFIAAGKAFAWLASSTDSTEMHLLALLVYFAPYFLLPFAFKLAGGLMATVFSIANDKSRGLFDRSKKYRQEKSAQTWQKTKSGTRFAGGNDTNFRGSLNRGLQFGALMPASRFNARRAKARIATARHDMAFDRAMEGLEKDHNMTAIAPDDGMLDAGLKSLGNESALRRTFEREYDGMFGQDAAGRQAYRKKVDEDTAAVSAAIRSMGWDSFKLAATAAKGGTKTGYAPSEEDPRDGNTQMMEAIKEASGGSEALAGRLLGATRSMAGRAGRDDLTASFGASVGELQKIMRGQGTVDGDKLALDVLENKDLSSLGRGDSRSVSAIAGAAERRIKSLSANTNRTPVESEELGRLSAILENWKGNGLYLPSARLSTITKAVENTTVERGNVRYEVEVTPEVRRIDGAKGQVIAPDVVKGYREQALNPARNIEDLRMHEIFERDQQAQQDQQNQQKKD